jgi:GNAT superfamily N-acetyltransferase
MRRSARSAAVRAYPSAGRVRHHRVVYLTLRRGIDNDAEAVAELYLRARNAAIPAIPMMVHTNEETRRWIAGRIIPQTELWVAESDDAALIGMLVLDDEWVDQLYVEPAFTGQGIGGELIALAKRERPSGLRLWTFESNVRARRFYERHAFSARDSTAGDNEEGAPAILYVWDGDDPD